MQVELEKMTVCAVEWKGCYEKHSSINYYRTKEKAKTMANLMFKKSVGDSGACYPKEMMITSEGGPINFRFSDNDVFSPQG